MSTQQALREERIKKLEKMRSIGWNPYPSSFDKKQSILQTRGSEGKQVQTAGRIVSFRTHGKIAFADIIDETGKIQLFFKQDLLGSEQFKNLNLLDIGDIIGVYGEVGKTTAGEISIIPSHYTILAKSLLPLPHEWYGVKDTEQKLRQRYLDLLLNPETRMRFNTRTKLLKEIRSYLDTLGFSEVETPIFHPLYGGANAKPFKTFYNALGQEMYLRVAFELYLKRLIVGGYEKVYEIGRDFRNEGVDRSHSPEFTMIEWYEAYADYNRVMDVTEGLFKHLAQRLTNSPLIQIDSKTIDLSGKWPRVSMVEIMKKEVGIDVENASELELSNLCKKHGAELIGGETKGQLIFALFEHTVPPKLIEPTWIVDYPEDVSPLSKNHRSKQGWVERFEGYIGGKEICDGWSELTDPLIQRQRFENDQKASRKDKTEAQQVDEDFLTAMEYAMPPTGGIGIGIERLVMFFTNTWSIRETILFPTLRNEQTPLKTEMHQTVSQTLPSTQDDQTRQKLYKLLTQHITNNNLIKHNLAVEAAMKMLSIRLKGNADQWGFLGLVHDLDWELTQKDHANHAKKTVEILKENGYYDEEILSAILAHNYTYTGSPPPQSNMAWALYCCDDLAGLIVATALITPDKKLSSVTTEAVLKKMKSKSFAASVNRDQIQLCQEKLGISLDEFVSIVLSAMQQVSKELGL